MQLRRLPEFIEARKRNWEILRLGLNAHDNVFEFALPTHATGWDPEHGFSWMHRAAALSSGRLQDRSEARGHLQPHRPGPGAMQSHWQPHAFWRQPGTAAAFVQLRQDCPTPYGWWEIWLIPIRS